jgi:predicted dehydrogenase
MNTNISKHISCETVPVHASPALRLAIIGVSGYAGVILNSLGAVLEGGGGRLVAATSEGRPSDQASEDILRGAGCRIFRDYRQMLSEVPVDICIVPTGIHWHASMSMAALNAGANVLVEKPLAGSLADAHSILEAETRSPHFIAVGFQDMYNTSTSQIGSFLSSALLGAVRRVRVCGSWPRGRSYYERNAWAGRIQVGDFLVNDSPLSNAFAHFLNLALLFASAGKASPDIEIRTCEGEHYRHYPIENFDSTAFVTETTESVRIECAFTHVDPISYTPVIFVEMERGSLTWEYEQRAVARDERGEVVQSWQLETAEESRRMMLSTVMKRVRETDAFIYPARAALNHCRVVEEVCKCLPIRSRVPADGQDAWRFRDHLFHALMESLGPLSQCPPAAVSHTSCTGA